MRNILVVHAVIVSAAALSSWTGQIESMLWNLDFSREKECGGFGNGSLMMRRETDHTCRRSVPLSGGKRLKGHHFNGTSFEEDLISGFLRVAFDLFGIR